MNTKAENVCKSMKCGCSKYVYPIIVHLFSVCLQNAVPQTVRLHLHVHYYS
jgi:hypothetical protein